MPVRSVRAVAGAFAAVLITAGAAGCGSAPAASAVSSVSSGGVAASFAANGTYSVHFTSPNMTFGGSLGATPSLTTSSGSDTLGSYVATVATYTLQGVSRRASMRVHSDGTVEFVADYLAKSANTAPFPALTSLPSLPYHVGYSDSAFAPITFSQPGIQGPYLGFDASAHTFLMSPGANFMIAAQHDSPTSISGGIDSAIPTLPAGFEHVSLLLAGTGINATLNRWGAALVRMSGQSRAGNESSTVLSKLGYWTDNGATYYYNTIPGQTGEQTMLTMRDQFAQAGIGLGYLQLDSWWYLKAYAAPNAASVPPMFPLPNGFNELQLMATVASSGGTPLTGRALKWTTAGDCASAGLHQVSSATDATGTGYSLLDSAAKPGFCTATVRDVTSSESSTVVATTTQNPRANTSSTLSASATSLPADGTSTVTLTAHVSGVSAADPVRFSATGSGCGTVRAPSATSSQGDASATYTASTTPGSCTVSFLEADGASTVTVAITQTQSPASRPRTASTSVVVTLVARDRGEYQYVTDPAYIPDTLAQFQQKLNLPLVTHARWLAYDSPYRAHYPVSNNVATSRAFYDNILSSTSAAGTIMYEQDWLSDKARPQENLNDPTALMQAIAGGAVDAGQTVMLCMAQPRHLLESSQLPVVTTNRVSYDRFQRGKWDMELYGSALTQALGMWPWTDVYRSSETNNLLLSTLSAGPVGVGDASGQLNAGNLLQAVRRDGTIVKPDVPLTPLDATYIAEAAARAHGSALPPMVATTYTAHGAGLRTHYVVAYARGGTSTFSFSLPQLGVSGAAYVYDYFNHSGTLVPSGGTFNGDASSGLHYYVVAPVGASGIAMVGDTGQFTTAGLERLSALSDDGAVHATLQLAPGESSAVIGGYAPSAVVATVNGTIAPVSWSPTTHWFSFTATQAGAITITPAPA